MAKAYRRIKSRKFSFGELFPFDIAANAISDLLVDYLEKTFLHFYGGEEKASIFGGLGITIDSGMNIIVAEGAVTVPNDFTTAERLRLAIHQENQLTVSDGDPTNDRIDIVLARFRRVDFQDATVNLLTASSGTTLQETRKIRYSYELETYIKEGTPAASPVAPTKDLGYDAFISSTIDWSATPTVDLSERYKIRLRIAELPAREVDLQGADPANTTLAEIVAAINAAFPELPSPPADGIGDILTITDTELSKSSGTVELTAPSLDPGPPSTNIDATDIIFGEYINEVPSIVKMHTNSSNYQITSVGLDDSFQIGEIDVDANQVALVAFDIKDLSQKDLWTTGLDSEIETDALGYIDHRLAPELDHPDDSVLLKHLAPEVINALLPQKTRRYETKLLADGPVADQYAFVKEETILTDDVGTDYTAFEGEANPANQRSVVFNDTGIANTQSVPAAYSNAVEEIFQIATDPDGLGRLQFRLGAIQLSIDTVGGSVNDLEIRVLKTSDLSVVAEKSFPAGGLTTGVNVFDFTSEAVDLDVATDYTWQVQQAGPTVVLDSLATSDDEFYRIDFLPDNGKGGAASDEFQIYIWDEDTSSIVSTLKPYAVDLSGALWGSHTVYQDPNNPADQWAAVDTQTARIKTHPSLSLAANESLRADFNIFLTVQNLDQDTLPVENEGSPHDGKGLRTFLSDYYVNVDELEQALTPTYNNLGTTFALDFDAETVLRVNVNGTGAFTIANTEQGGVYIVIIENISGGTVSGLTWPAAVEWPDATPLDEMDADTTAVVTFVSDGTNLFAVDVKNYQV